MVKSKHLLVVAQKLALIAELEPTKKAGFYVLRSLRQINGDFIKNNQLITDNLVKLFGKLDTDQTYTLVLPDNLFLDKIENIPAITDNEIKKQLSEQILPDLKINLDDYQIKTASLLQLGQTSRIQISAAEDKFLAEITQALSEVENSPLIENVVPMSWLTKSIVTLEPSLSIFQIGDELLLAQHYIGIVQTKKFDVSELVELVNFIKKLKEKEADLQTVYLLTDEKVEKALNKGLKDLLPLQQLSGAETGDGVAPMIKAYLEAAARSMDIPEYAIPFYSLEKIKILSTSAAATPTKAVNSSQNQDTNEITTENETETSENEATSETENIPEAIEENETDIEKASEMTITDDAGNLETLDPKSQKISEDNSDEINSINSKGKNENLENSEDISLAEAVAKEKKMADVNQFGSIDDLSEEESSSSVNSSAFNRNSIPANSTAVGMAVATTAINSSSASAKTAEIARDVGTRLENDSISNTSDEKMTHHNYLSAEKNASADNIISQPALVKEEKNMSDFNYEPSLAQRETPTGQQIPANSYQASVTPPPKKTASGGKKVMVFLGIFLLTVAIGLALGFGAIALLNKDTQQAEDVTPKPTPAPVIEEPVASESAEVLEKIDRTAEKILVVNATTTAGLAGKLQSTLKEAGYTQVETGNSADSELYKSESYYILLPKENKSLVTDLGEVTQKTLTAGTSYDDEDDGKNYDAIIVINTSD